MQAKRKVLAKAADGALANLNCIHDLALEAEALGERRASVYVRNAHDCKRWCVALRDAGVAYPAWMYATGLNYFSHIWDLGVEVRS